MGVKNEVMALFRMVDGESQQMKPAVHPSFPFYEHTDEQLGYIQEEYRNLSAEENSLHVEILDGGDFEEGLRPPLQDKYKDIFLEDESPKWDIYSFSSSIGYLCQEARVSLESIENIPYETHKEEQGMVFSNREEATEVAGSPCMSFLKNNQVVCRGRYNWSSDHGAGKCREQFRTTMGFMIRWLTTWSSLVMTGVQQDL